LRETVEFDVLYIGCGISSLSSALHLSRLLKKEGINFSIAILEKAYEPGGHTISGAVIKPEVIYELFPLFSYEEVPLMTPVKEDRLYFLTSKRAINIPILPPQFNNKGNYIISINQLVKWMVKVLEKEGVEIFYGFPAQEIIYENNKVVGVVAGEKGINKKNEKKTNYDPGVNIKSKVTVFAEGSYGFLTTQLIKKLNLNKGRNPQNYATGVKELWKVHPSKHKEGLVIHTFGYPLTDVHAGGFIYHLKDNLVSIGYVISLNYKNPYYNAHEELQKLKMHPFISNMLEGEILGYGAKTIPEGGYFSLPKYYGDGFLIIGDAAGFLSSIELKGIHLAMKSGMLAAETILHAIKNNDFSQNTLSKFYHLVEESIIKKSLWKSRNFHQGFKNGLILGILHTAIQTITGGRDILSRMPSIEDYLTMKKIKKKKIKEKISFDSKLTFDKLTSVYYSQTSHEEDQPCHIVISDTNICNTKCKEEYGNPCQYFCPANVYEMVYDETLKKEVIKLNPANCLHCKTCEIKDPYKLIFWKIPEGKGPNYSNL
jgi:electron-transferring-flavoprotein dehydrogenase